MNNYHYYLYTRVGCVGVDRFSHKGYGLSRGRCRQYELRLPLTWRWTLHLSTRGKDYLTLVGGPKELRNINWVIDEFDASFNNLAVASLRYHLDWSVCDNSDRRQEYEDLINRLSEEPPDPTPEEDAAIDTWDPFTVKEGEHYRMTDCPPAAAAAFDSWQSREDEWIKRINRARHDFVDIMRGLWS